MQRNNVKEITLNNSNYKITIDNSKILGQGAFGVVYAGKATLTREELAIKFISVQSKENKENCDKEIEIMRALTGTSVTNIIQLHGYQFEGDISNGQFVIAMGYAANGTLRELLSSAKQPCFDLKFKKQVMLGIANGISYMHDAGIIHCDLKTENILIDGKMEPMICDFGLSKRVAHDNLTHFKGNLLYASPELLFARCSDIKASQSEKTDMYAFALLCWCIVTQTKDPYHQYNKTGNLRGLFDWVVTQNKRLDIPPDPYCPSLIAKLIELSWDKIPDNRPTAKQAVLMLRDEKYPDDLSQQVSMPVSSDPSAHTSEANKTLSLAPTEKEQTVTEQTVTEKSATKNSQLTESKISKLKSSKHTFYQPTMNDSKSSSSSYSGTTSLRNYYSDSDVTYSSHEIESTGSFNGF